VCANHQSFFDPVLVGLTCPRRLNYVARTTLFRCAPFRWLIHWYDAIPIEREGLGIGGLKETLRRLKRGELVLVFPEGTRTSDGQIGRLQPGICALVRRAGVPIVPVGIDGAFDAWPRGQRWPRCVPIRIWIGHPLDPAELGGLSDEQLLEALTGQLERCLAAARHGGGRTISRGRVRQGDARRDSTAAFHGCSGRPSLLSLLD
jgi:1-acyl-sn-glycerol-3-phosphate acyltransferase